MTSILISLSSVIFLLLNECVNRRLWDIKNESISFNLRCQWGEVWPLIILTRRIIQQHLVTCC